MTKLVVGIDEAGRGPLAGPVTVGVFAAKSQIKKWLLKNLFRNKLRDSKKLSPNQRVAMYRYICRLKKMGKVDFSVAHSSPQMIDKRGISEAIKQGIKKCLKNLTPGPSPRGRRGEEIRLDGLLKAPEEFKNQKTIVKGDEKDVFIACASIVAKVSRDRLMCKLSKKYPEYSFEIHKGYGTALHCRLIKKHGLSEIHRKSFCKNLTP